jgi:tetratricopeptide (TPR) repeat protein
MGNAEMKSKWSRFGIICLVLMLGGCAAKNSISTQEMAFSAYERGDFTEASQIFGELTEEIPKDAELWFKLGNSYARDEKPHKAIDAYQNALLREPGLAKAWYNMGIVQMQIALKTFVDMNTYSKGEEPTSGRGEKMRQGLLSLLQADPEQQAD